MSTINLKDILINARQESYRMRHFYIGVEHLFIALIEIQGGLATTMLREKGITPEYVTDAIRRKVGKGSKRRLWAGLQNSPRADVVLSIANDIAIEEERREINERDLLIAILEENDNVPTRTLKALGLNVTDLAKAARTVAPDEPNQRSYVRIDFGEGYNPEDALTREERFILQRVFRDHQQIRIDRRLSGVYSEALVFNITGTKTGENQPSPGVVVKIDQTDRILDEVQRYESRVKDTLPENSARIAESPTAPEISELAGLKYSLSKDDTQLSLKTMARDLTRSTLGNWLENELFAKYGEKWWKQSRPYRFQVWSEYDWLLPPVLSLEVLKGTEVPTATVNSQSLDRKTLTGMKFSDVVTLQKFVVQHVDRNLNIIHVSTGQGTEAAKRAHQIEVRGLDLEQDTYYRGETIDLLIGRVWKTRRESLSSAVRTLEPDFPVDGDTISVGENPKRTYPNPVVAHETLSERWVNGTLSKIHGALHIDNVFVGEMDDAILVDYAHFREGHTLFDWATLEISILSSLVLSEIEGDGWKGVMRVIEHLSALNHNTTIDDADLTIAETINPIKALRNIAKQCLAQEGGWGEYYAALAMCALNHVTNNKLPLHSRRLMYLFAALAIQEVENATGLYNGVQETESPDNDTNSEEPEPPTPKEDKDDSSL